MMDWSDPGRYRVRPLFSSVFFGGVALFAGYCAAHDWLRLDGWTATWLGFGLYLGLSVTQSVPRSILYGALFGISAISIAFWWAIDMFAYILDSDGMAPRWVFLLLVLSEALPFAVLAGIAARMRVQHAGYSLWFSICSLAALGAFWPRVFRWEIGHSLLTCLPLAQTAEIGGGAALSLVVLLSAAVPWAILLCWQHPAQSAAQRRLLYGLIASGVLLPLIAAGWGQWRIAEVDHWMAMAPKIRVGCVQDYPADVTSIARMCDASVQSLDSADLLCWPESALGTHSIELDSFADMLQVDEWSVPPIIDPTPLQQLHQPLLVGGRTFVADKHDDVPYYQTAFMVAADSAVLGRYHKRGLMPFGEYVPGDQWAPALRDWFQLGNVFLRGETADLLIHPNGTSIGPLICYEDTSPSLVRETAARNPDFLACIINASAFRHPLALQQHLRLAQLRSIENRKYLVRASGTGVSCGVDAVGRVLQPIAPDAVDTVLLSVPRLSERTFFNRYGNWLAISCVALAGTLLVHASVSERRPRL